MKPGYYLSETGNFQIWYPKDFFEKGKQRLDFVNKDGVEETVDYDIVSTTLIISIFDFEFIGNL